MRAIQNIFLENINEDDKNEDELLWMKSIYSNPAFDFLNDDEEDVYFLTDGEPFENHSK